ncbi:hypothetical protein [Pandoravirus japonicus]|uniref:Uncharacterized protein n=1 Tax=Pandoravirus japonicus TaxID=2823154 RepID=A0A811BM05_9VIRU|nr:hypothetical protein [Pandoravirus japonicus]
MSAVALTKRRLAKRTKRGLAAVAAPSSEPSSATIGPADSVPVQADSAAVPLEEAVPAQEPFAFNEEAHMEVAKDTPAVAATAVADDAAAATPSPATDGAQLPTEDAGAKGLLSPEPALDTDPTPHVTSETVEETTTIEPVTDAGGDSAVIATTPLAVAASSIPVPPADEDAMDQEAAQVEEDQTTNNKRPRGEEQSDDETPVDDQDTVESVESTAGVADDDNETGVALPLKKRRRMLVPEEEEGEDRNEESEATAADDAGDRQQPTDNAVGSEVAESTDDAGTEDSLGQEDDYVTDMDDYRPAVRRLGVIRLFVLIEYMTALVGGGHCLSFDMGTAVPSSRPAIRATRRLGRTDDGRRFVCGVDWHLSGGDGMVERALPRGATRSGRGTAFDPYVATIKSAVATPEIVEPLYDDWAPCLFDQRLARPQDKIVLRFALSDRAERDAACEPLAWLLDDVDAAALPPAGQRVAVHMDAVWRRLDAFPHAFDGAARHAGRYRSLMAPAVAPASSPALPLGTAPIAASS